MPPSIPAIPAIIPIFPLSNVVLFPRVHLPLHIFEPRYRQMVADALKADRIIGMVLLRPGWEADYHGRPAVYSVGCAGQISEVDRHADGRYNLVLEGLERFRILSEDWTLPYRRAAIERLPDDCPLHERAALASFRERLERLLLRPNAENGARVKSAGDRLADEELVNALAHYLDLEPLEKQSLLETNGPCARCQQLIALLEFRLLASKRPAHGGAH